MSSVRGHRTKMTNHEDHSYSETGFLCQHAEKQAFSEQGEVPDDHHSSRGINTKVYSLELTWELSPVKTKNTPTLMQNRGSFPSSGEGGIRRIQQVKIHSVAENAVFDR